MNSEIVIFKTQDDNVASIVFKFRTVEQESFNLKVTQKQIENQIKEKK